MAKKRKGQVPNRQQEIYNMLGGQPIAYNPSLIKVVGSVNAAILLGQLLFWQGLGRYGDWVYKTSKDMQEETGLTRSRQDKAISDCERLGLLEVRLHGIPAKRHFKVDIRRLTSLIYSLQESGKLARPKPVGLPAQNPQRITETTSDITTDTNTVNIKRYEAMKAPLLKR